MKNFQILGGVGYLLQSISFIVAAAQARSIFASVISSSAPTTTSVAMITPLPSPMAGIIPFLVTTIIQFLSTALACLAWISAGRLKRNSVFIVTGAIGLTSLASSVGLVFLSGGLVRGPAQSSQSIQSLLPAMVTILAIVGVGAALGVAFFVLEIVSLFSASKAFGVRYFRLSGFGMIASIAIAAVAFAVAMVTTFVEIASTLPRMPGAQPGQIPPGVMVDIFSTFSLIFWVIAVPFVISSILAATAFFKIAADETANPAVV